jgi:hypothetical protein
LGAEYVFVDEWDVDAQRTPPSGLWPTQPPIPTGGDPSTWRSRATVRQNRRAFPSSTSRGGFPYTLRTRSEIVSYEPPDTFEVKVVGDLKGRGVWPLTPRDGVIHVHFDRRVIADRPLLRYLTPVLRPLFPGTTIPVCWAR